MMGKKYPILLIVTLLSTSTMWAADGDVFTAKTVEGVDMMFQVLSEAEKTCEVGRYCISKDVTAVTIPETASGYSVTTIGWYAFAGCKALTSVVIPNSVTSIGTYSFNGCNSLITLTIPKNVNIIGRRAFLDCVSLSSITVEAGNTVYDSRDNCNAIIKTDTNELIVGSNNTIIPNGVVSIAEYAFKGRMGLKTLFLPASLTSIAETAFRNCGGLSAITVDPDNNKYDSRDDCNAVIEKTKSELIIGCENTVIPNNIASIGDHAFSGCSGLVSVIIPSSVTSIGNYAFYYCI